MRALLLIPALAVLLLAGSAAAESPTLHGTVGPGFAIRLTDAAGNPVRHLDVGTYTVEIQDLSAEHNFHLTGPGVDQATAVEDTGTVTWTVTLGDARYHFQCDAHPTLMKGDVYVGTATPPPPPPKPVLLRATVGPGATISLTKAGVRVRVLAPGPAVIAVRALSVKDNFHLIGPGVNRLTSKAARATLSWRVSLRAGTYRYRSDASPTLKGSFTVHA
jgi:hypothetical protein